MEPNLCEIRGNLIIGAGYTLAALSLPRLATLNGYLLMTDHRSRITIDLPALQRVEGGFILTNNAELEAVSLGALTTASNALVITSNPKLTALSWLMLTAAGGVAITDNSKLQAVSAPLLADVSMFEVGNLPRLSTLNQDSLAFVENDLTIHHNAFLPAVSLPALAYVGRDLGISRNDSLATIAVPALASMGVGEGNGIEVASNPLVSDLTFPKLASAPSAELRVRRTRILPPGASFVTAWLKRWSCGVGRRSSSESRFRSVS